MLPTHNHFLATALTYPTAQDASRLGFEPERHSECSICLDECALPLSSSELHNEESHILCKISPCGHWFGASCLHTWLQERNTCPLCRRKLFLTPLFLTPGVAVLFLQYLIYLIMGLMYTLVCLAETCIVIIQARVIYCLKTAPNLYKAHKNAARCLLSKISRCLPCGLHPRHRECATDIIAIYQRISDLFTTHETVTQRKPYSRPWSWTTRQLNSMRNSAMNLFRDAPRAHELDSGHTQNPGDVV